MIAALARGLAAAVADGAEVGPLVEAGRDVIAVVDGAGAEHAVNTARTIKAIPARPVLDLFKVSMQRATARSW